MGEARTILEGRDTGVPDCVNRHQQMDRLAHLAALGEAAQGVVRNEQGCYPRNIIALLSQAFDVRDAAAEPRLRADAAAILGGVVALALDNMPDALNDSTGNLIPPDAFGQDEFIAAALARRQMHVEQQASTTLLDAADHPLLADRIAIRSGRESRMKIVADARMRLDDQPDHRGHDAVRVQLRRRSG
jgi:hypothetical protein